MQTSTTETVRFERTESNWRRIQRYTSESEPSGVLEGIWAAGDGDESPTHSIYKNGNSAECGWCWLGYGHTSAVHAQKVVASREAA